MTHIVDEMIERGEKTPGFKMDCERYSLLPQEIFFNKEQFQIFMVSQLLDRTSGATFQEEVDSAIKRFKFIEERLQEIK